MTSVRLHPLALPWLPTLEAAWLRSDLRARRTGGGEGRRRAPAGGFGTLGEKPAHEVGPGATEQRAAATLVSPSRGGRVLP